jgi:hypothetical protein
MSLHGFNLLQNNVRPPDAWDKLNDWVTNVGRIIVIIVEVVVIVSFIARVVIDTQTKNLLEKEQANSQAIVALRDREVRFRTQQAQFETYKQIWDTSSSYTAIMTELDKLRPKSIEKLSVSLQGDLITFSGEASVTSIGQFENSLKTSAKYADVQVDEIEKISGDGQANRASFSIRMILQPTALQAREKFNQEETQTNAGT